MEEKPSSNNLERRVESAENTLKASITILIVCAVFAILATGLAIFGATQANRALQILEDNDLVASEENEDEEEIDDESQDEEETYAKPKSAESIETISFVYNNANDFADVFDDSIEYYAFDLNDEYQGDVVEVDGASFFKYVFNNDLDKLNETAENEDDTWSIAVYSNEGTSYVGGKDSAPDWFNDLLKKIDVETNGYYSRK